MEIEEALKIAEDLDKLAGTLSRSFPLPHPYDIYEAVILLAKEYRHLTSKCGQPDIIGCDCHSYYTTHGRHSIQCPLYKSGG